MIRCGYMDVRDCSECNKWRCPLDDYDDYDDEDDDYDEVYE